MSTLDFRAQSELGSLCRDLLQDLERLRPGWPAGLDDAAPEDQRRAALHAIGDEVRARIAVRLPELFREGPARSLDEAAAPGQLQLYQREVEQILVPRYVLLAARQNQLERRPTGPLRGAMLYNTVVYAALFFCVGVFVVWAPFIPLWDKWIPWVLAALSPWLAPFLPDLHRVFIRRRHEVQLLSLLIDLDLSGSALPAGLDDAPPLLGAAVQDPGAKETPSP